MTKSELKSIINECIEERLNNIDNITEDTDLVFNEGLFDKMKLENEVRKWITNASILKEKYHKAEYGKGASSDKRKILKNEIIDHLHIYEDNYDIWKDTINFKDYNAERHYTDLCNSIDYKKGMSNNNSKKPIEEIIDSMINDVKKIEDKFMSDKSYIDKINKALQKGLRDNMYDKEDIPKVNRSLLKATNEGDYIGILEEDQTINVVLSFILNDIIKELYKKSIYKKYSLSTGDGDEGCIYID